MSGVSQRQQCGYECSYSPARNSLPDSRSASTMCASASRTCMPANGPVRSSKVPSGRTGLWIVSPFSVASRKSSSPKAAPVWTTPVPSSIETKSPARTVWPRSP